MIYASAETYTFILYLAGLSRALIAGGLHYFEQSGILKIHLERWRNLYEICGFNKKVSGWCKLPHRSPIGPDGAIIGFRRFTMRNKYELYTLKLWLYLLQAWDNVSAEVQTSYEKINEGTASPRRRFPGLTACDSA